MSSLKFEQKNNIDISRIQQYLDENRSQFIKDLQDGTEKFGHVHGALAGPAEGTEDYKNIMSEED